MSQKEGYPAFHCQFNWKKQPRKFKSTCTTRHLFGQFGQAKAPARPPTVLTQEKPSKPFCVKLLTFLRKTTLAKLTYVNHQLVMPICSMYIEYVHSHLPCIFITQSRDSEKPAPCFAYPRSSMVLVYLPT